MSDDQPDRESETNLSRRRLLLSTLTGASLPALSGCGGVTDQTFTASPAGLSAEGMIEFEYSTADHNAFSETRSRSVAGTDVEVTAENHLVVYGLEDERATEDDPGDAAPALPARWSANDRQGRSLGILSTPTIGVAGQEFNPFATASFAELLTGPEGETLLRRTGVTANAPEWTQSPTRVGRTTAELLGSETAVESFFGVLSDDEGENVEVLVHLARVTHEGDIVVVGGVQRRRMRPLDGRLDDDEERDGEQADGPRLEDESDRSGKARVSVEGDDTRLTDRDLTDRRQFVLDALPHVRRKIDIDLSDIPKLRLKKTRLVQTVEDTRVQKVGSRNPTVLYREPDPPIVAGQNTAAVFGLADTGYPPPSGPVTVEVRREYANASPDTDTFTLSKTEADDLEWYTNTRGELEKLQDMATDGSTANDLPVFAPRADLTAVRVTIGAGGGVIGDSVRLVAGPAGDFTVADCRPLRVAFVEVRDGDRGANYGTSTGRVQEYNTSVDAAVEYMKRVFPSDLLAYRFDVPLNGETDAGKKHLIKDHHDGYRFADMVLNMSWFFPSHGTFLATPNGTAQAEQTLKQSGFDVVVLIVPAADPSNRKAISDYYGFHNKSNVGGLAPWSSKAAVSGIETGNLGSEMATARIAAQEAGHRLVSQPYPDPKPSDPLSQRRGNHNAETTYKGNHIDYDHARNEQSDHDDDGTTDDPGVVSIGYDLTDGTFTSVSGTGFDSNGQLQTGGSFGPEPLASFMSYSNLGDYWTDARIHRRIVRYLSTSGGGSSGESGSGSQSVLSGVGFVDDGQIVVEDVAAGPGFPRTGGDEGSVQVSVTDPTGEVLLEDTVEDAGQVTHLGSVSGVFSFHLPFPTDAVELAVSPDGARTPTRLNPVVRSVRDAIGRVPEGGFAASRRIRDRFTSGLDQVDRLMAESAFDEAATVLDREVATPLDDVRTTYEPALNRPPKSALTALVGRMTTRLERLAERQG